MSPASLPRWLNKIHTGDCLKKLRQLPDESVDLVVTSPPYNIKNSTGNGLKCGNGGKWPNAGLINGYDSHDDCMPRAEYVRWQQECLIELLRVVKPTGAIFYNHKRRVQNGLNEDPWEIVGHTDIPVRQIIIWKRNGGINFNPGYFLPTYEVLYLIAKPKFRLAPKANTMGDVWEISQSAERNEHPAPFPTELARRCLGATNGGVVLDPFIGSGTTAVAAIGEGWDYIGIDKSAKYCRMARERIKKTKREMLWSSKCGMPLSSKKSGKLSRTASTMRARVPEQGALAR